MFTPEDFDRVTREIVAENPAFNYREANPDIGDMDDCLYLRGDEPSCLYGHVFCRLGVPLDVIREHERTSVAAALAEIVKRFCKDKWTESKLDYAGIWADYVQDRQDRKFTWQESLEFGDRRIVDLNVELENWP